MQESTTPSENAYESASVKSNSGKLSCTSLILSAWVEAKNDNQHDKLAGILTHSHFSLHNDMKNL